MSLHSDRCQYCDYNSRVNHVEKNFPLDTPFRFLLLKKCETFGGGILLTNWQGTGIIDVHVAVEIVDNDIDRRKTWST